MTTNEFLKLAMVDEGMAAAKKQAAESAGKEEEAASAEAEREAAAIGEDLADGAGGGGGGEVAATAGPLAGLRRIKAEELNASQRWWLIESAKVRTLTEMAADLRVAGAKISQPTLSRLLGRVRQIEAIEMGKELGETAGALAEQSKGSKLREGALEAARQKIFQRALRADTPKAVMEVYGALSKEEERLRRVAVEEEKARQNERRLELERRRVEIAAAKLGGGKYFLEALRILLDEKLEDRAKVEKAVAQLQGWMAGAIEVGGEVKRLEAKMGS